jgi:hypothetical protein
MEREANCCDKGALLRCNLAAAGEILGRFTLKASVTPTVEASGKGSAWSVMRYFVALWSTYLSRGDRRTGSPQSLAAFV